MPRRIYTDEELELREVAVQKMKKEIADGYDPLVYTEMKVAGQNKKALEELGYVLPCGINFIWLFRNEDLCKIGSEVLVKAECNICGDIREVRAHRLSNRCRACANKGKTLSEEHKEKISEVRKKYFETHDSPTKGRRMWPNPEDHPMYNPELTDEDRKSRSGAHYKKWVDEVKEKDNYECVACGDNETKLVCHHLESYRNNKELRTEVSNGVCLCDKCHKEFHKKFGYGNNTAQQFEQFMFEREEK